jgi:hypothetical protein
VARAVTGRDPFNKYPAKDGRVICVGKSLLQVGQVMYRTLFRAGPFEMIRDLETKQWRTFCPNHPADMGRIVERRMAPPLIPRRFVKSISWYNKKSSEPRAVTLTTGWEILFFSGEGKPPHGLDVDLIWFDEEIPESDWLGEMQARILDRNGCILWSATPQAGTEQLFDLHERSLEESGDERPSVKTYHILLDDNTFMADEAKEAFKKNQKNEDTYRVRILGQFAVESRRVYPNFGDAHKVNAFEVPPDWCIDVAIDPGRQRGAALLIATPPPGDRDWGGHSVAFEEVYQKNSDAKTFAEALAAKLRSRRANVFIIDSHEARKHETGSGKTVQSQYTKWFKKNGLKSRLSGFGFIGGNDDPEGGIEVVRDWLADTDDGRPRILFMRGRCDNLFREMGKYRYKVDKERITDVVVKKDDHLVDCLRYICSYGPRYVKPRSVETKLSSFAVLAMAAKRRRQREASGPKQTIL